MLLKCIREFTTRENGGIPFTLMEGTVWYKSSFDYAPGGYELIVLEQVERGEFTGIVTKVRLERINDRKLMEPVPLMECPIPVGCSVFHGE